MSAGDVPQFDIVIVGCGLSGVVVAHNIRKDNPTLSYCILERRSAVGGTWHLHTYPCIRSDSDAYTFSLPVDLLPWDPNSYKPLAAGATATSAEKDKKTAERWFGEGYELHHYIETAWRKVGADKHTIFNAKVDAMQWRSEEQRWTFDVSHCTDNANDDNAASAPPPPRKIKSRFVYLAAGYYNYDQPLKPTYPGMDKPLNPPSLMRRVQF